MIDEILSIVLRAVYWLLLPAALLRFQMQAVRAPFRNPVGQFVCAVTDWAVLPLRRLFAGRGGKDWPSLAAAFLIQLLYGLLFDLLSMRLSIFRGAAAVWITTSCFEFVSAILWVAIWCLVVYAVLSLVRADSALSDILEALVNPWLRPVRRRIPMVGAFDLSPFVLVVLLQVCNVVVGYAQAVAVSAVMRL